MRLLLAIIFIFLTTHGICCTYGQAGTLAEAYQISEKIIVGTVLEQEPKFQIDSVEYNRLIKNGLLENQARRFTSYDYYGHETVLIELAFMGAFASDTIAVQTGLTGGTCGYAFELGNKSISYYYNSIPILSESKDRTVQF